jgi:DNA-binding PadR family transcriptional regulator
MGDKEEMLLKLLSEKGEMTTTEVEDAIKESGGDCPDGAVKSLMRLKTQGIIEGRIDREKRGWVWKTKRASAPDHLPVQKI